MKEKIANRWIILGASILCNLCVGAGYAWSIYQVALIKQFNWVPSQASLAFTIGMIMMPIAMTITGKFLDKTGPKIMMTIGAIMYGLGVLLTGFTTSLVYLYIIYGGIVGLGCGVIYSVAITNTVKWFPDKKGLASGLIAAGLGMGAVVFSPIINKNIMSYGVLTTFKIMGIIYFTIIIVCSLLEKLPPSGYIPEGWVPPAAAINASSVDKSCKEMLSEPIFYILWVMYIMGTVAGLMIIGHAFPMAQEKLKISAESAALVVSFLAFGNTAGRVVWGFISDKVGRYKALMVLYLISASSIFILSRVDGFYMFTSIIIIIGLCYGGLLGIYPTITAEMFGMKNLGQNYGVMFTATSVAAMVGPRLAAKVKESSGGNYDSAFVIAGVMGAIGLILTLFVISILKKKFEKEKQVCGENFEKAPV